MPSCLLFALLNTCCKSLHTFHLFIWLVILCHIIYFPKSCWNQAITLKDILENIPKPLGEKPEWLAPSGHNAIFENNGRVVKLGCKSRPKLWKYTWILHPIHLASLQRAKAIWAAIFFPRLHGENVNGQGQRYFPHWFNILIWEIWIVNFIEQSLVLQGHGILTKFFLDTGWRSKRGTWRKRPRGTYTTEMPS